MAQCAPCAMIGRGPGRIRHSRVFRMEQGLEQDLENKDSGPQAFLDFVNQRLAKRQRELDGAVKFSSHYGQVEAVVMELRAIRTKFVTLMRREGLL